MRFGALWLVASTLSAGNPNLAELGRRLFYDKRMSGNGAQSCASCHRQELAFTDGRSVAVGATGQAHTRSSMSLVNVAYAQTLTWADPAMRSLEKQALVPMFGENPVELGVREEEFLRVLQSDPVYRELFPKAFLNSEQLFTISNVARALAAFEQSIVSTRSAYDRYYYVGEMYAISEAAKRGEVLFYTDTLGGCFRCHSGKYFTDGQFHNTALAEGQEAKFRTPTLRNVELTAPYMHDGSIATLEEVIEHYAAGGRAHDNPRKDPRMKPLPLTPRNKADLVEFLKALTDREVITDPKFADPWQR
jgi:cytochrome c peroxidase